jgi:hypothetical protein
MRGKKLKKYLQLLNKKMPIIIPSFNKRKIVEKRENMKKVLFMEHYP